MKTNVTLLVALLSIVAGFVYANDRAKMGDSISTSPPPDVIFHTGSFFDGTLVQVRGKSISKKPAEAKRRLEAYQSLWKQDGKRILEAMRDALGVSFSDNRLHVILSEEFGGAYSMPLTVSIWYEETDFVAMMTHEIAHWLLNNNTQHVDVGNIWYKMFPDEFRLTRNHILVFAVMEHIFTDVLGKPEMLAFEKNATGSYGRAWEIVQNRGHRAIIAEFRQHYTPEPHLLSVINDQTFLHDLGENESDAEIRKHHHQDSISIQAISRCHPETCERVHGWTVSLFINSAID